MGPGDREQAEQHEPDLRSSQDEGEQTVGEAGSPSLLGRLALSVIGAYQKTAKYRPPVCRFRPTCSEYTRQAIVKYGFLKGSAMGAWRICRCHPFAQGGEDPVP